MLRSKLNTLKLLLLRYVSFKFQFTPILEADLFFSALLLLKTFLMICQPYVPLRNLIFVMNSTAIWAQTLSMLRMPLLGGMGSVLFILVSIAWCWITLLSLVSHKFIYYIIIIISMITCYLSYIRWCRACLRLLLSHIRSRLSVQSTRALMCLGVWSKLGFVTDSDVKAVVLTLLELNEDDVVAKLDIHWDRIY